MEHGQELQTPDWMSCLPAELLDVPLWNLAIPGSHDSMSFCLDLSSPVLGSEPVALKVLEFLFPCFTRPCIYRWATTQGLPQQIIDFHLSLFSASSTLTPTACPPSLHPYTSSFSPTW
uniref:PI-PLC X domain-containing protein 1-like n=1 Tax=Cynoglossus semilaevis TaxID=244447 RepID=A0A3P8VBD0_CYNSE